MALVYHQGVTPPGNERAPRCLGAPGMGPARGVPRFLPRQRAQGSTQTTGGRPTDGVFRNRCSSTVDEHHGCGTPSGRRGVTKRRNETARHGRRSRPRGKICGPRVQTQKDFRSGIEITGRVPADNVGELKKPLRHNHLRTYRTTTRLRIGQRPAWPPCVPYPTRSTDQWTAPPRVTLVPACPWSRCGADWGTND